MSTRVNDESGFTLLELMVVTAVLGVLASMSLASFHKFKDSAFYSVSEQTLNTARTALEAGKVEIDSLDNNSYSFYQTTPGPITSSRGQILAPGLVVPKDTRLFVYHNPNCDSGGWCLEDQVWLRNCKSSKYLYYLKYSNGYEYQVEDIKAGWDC